MHWSAEEVHDAFAPHEDTVAALRSWLQESGIAEERIKHSSNKGWMSFSATAAEAEELLRTEFYEHQHISSGKMSVGCDEYHLPAHVQPLIDYVTPGVKTAELRKRKLRPSGQKPSPGPFMKVAEPPSFTNISSNVSNCDSIITPACVQALYNIPEPATDVATGNGIGVFEDGDYYAQEDLNLFFSHFAARIPQGTHPTLASIDGGEAPVPVGQAGGESDLDFQLVYPIVYPQEVTVYQVDDVNYAEGIVPSKGFGNTFLDALDGSYCNYTAYNETGDSSLDPQYPDTHKNGFKGQLMCGVYKPTNVISISYGLQEDDLPAGYQERQCNEFMKLGLQGVSIFVASGDTGVAGTAGDGNPNGCLGPKGKVFNPTNPNTCPYVTNVGATMVGPGRTVAEPESAAWGEFDNGTDLFTSSGGFSNIYTVPSYQQAAIDTYFAKYNPPYESYNITGGFNAAKAGNGVYNRIGHGVPDVAANGLNIGVYNQGAFTQFGGTSASSPIFASIVSRINDARLNAGKKPVGFINPALYQNPSMLNDITNGTNPGCGTQGFKAVPGWDPVTGKLPPSLPCPRCDQPCGTTLAVGSSTEMRCANLIIGLGTPNFPKMLSYFSSLP